MRTVRGFAQEERVGRQFNEAIDESLKHGRSNALAGGIFQVCIPTDNAVSFPSVSLFLAVFSALFLFLWYLFSFI